MFPSKIKKIIDNKKTLLCVGVMSKNVVDASIELANEKKIPIILIASRRQIEAKEFGGGYANKWDTLSFSKYVRKKDKSKNIFLARDHGGPWQNTFEISENYNYKKAMKSAKFSFKCDIDCGFDFLHIDTSESIHGVSKTQAFKRLCELYLYCENYAQKKSKNIFYEIGTEEQSGFSGNFKDLIQTLEKFKQFCIKKKIKWPSFVVAQCGTKVMETRNVGTFESLYNIKNEFPVEILLMKTLETCKKYDILMKEHNADYLNTNSLEWHPKLGIQAVNVAPEFGVVESRHLLKLLKDNKMSDDYERFIQLSYDSKKWEKWMLKDEKSSREHKAIISGHYVFKHPEVEKIRENLIKKVFKKKRLLDEELKRKIKSSINRYLKSFRLLES